MATASTRLVEYLTGLNEAEIAPVLPQHATLAVLDNVWDCMARVSSGAAAAGSE